MRKRIKIYGERNTGTNYLEQIIGLNLDVEQIPGIVPPRVLRLQKTLPGRELVRDVFFSLTFGQNLGWKHTRVKPISELGRYAGPQKATCFLSVTKNPYSWVLSLYRRPYHQYYQEKPDLVTFLCTPWKTVGRDNCGQRVLKSPVELWNLKNRSYLPLAEVKGMELKTERLLEDPEAVIENISQAFAIERCSGAFWDYDQSTKEKDKNREYYKDYYLNEKWRAELTSDAIRVINETVDKDLMKHFGYAVLS